LKFEVEQQHAAWPLQPWKQDGSAESACQVPNLRLEIEGLWDAAEHEAELRAQEHRILEEELQPLLCEIWQMQEALFVKHEERQEVLSAQLGEQQFASDACEEAYVLESRLAELLCLVDGPNNIEASVETTAATTVAKASFLTHSSGGPGLATPQQQFEAEEAEVLGLRCGLKCLRAELSLEQGCHHEQQKLWSGTAKKETESEQLETRLAALEWDMEQVRCGELELAAQRCTTQQAVKACRGLRWRVFELEHAVAHAELHERLAGRKQRMREPTAISSASGRFNSSGDITSKPEERFSF